MKLLDARFVATLAQLRLNLNCNRCIHSSQAQGFGRAGIVLGGHVKEAFANGEPVVALESTVITHGLPEPENLELALTLERIISHIPKERSVNRTSLTESQAFSSVVPATIGIVRGQIAVGLSKDELEYLSSREQSKPTKASRRDIPIALGLGLSAGTTVSATMAIACSLQNNQRSLVSPIKVFVTGGTGGVHVGGEQSMDISADLYEFARSPIGVVSSGFKSFLDTRRSLEFLETMGSTVMSLVTEHADCADKHLFPAFFSSWNKQGIRSPQMVDSVEDATKILFHCLEGSLANNRASLIAVPIPQEFSLEGEDYEILRRAMNGLSRVDTRIDIEGKEKTPMMLEKLNLATGGKTLRANVELLKNNALVGAQIALEYAKISNRTGPDLPMRFARGEFSANNHSEITKHLNLGTKVEKSTRTTADEESDGKKLQDFEGSGRSDTEDAARRPSHRVGPIVVGCTMVDMNVSIKMDENFRPRTFEFQNNPRHSGITFGGKPHLALGGVGRNLATAIEFLGHQPIFITSLARDNLGSFALAELLRDGFPPDRLKISWLRNGQDGSIGHTDDKPSSCFALVLIDSLDGQCECVIANLAANKGITRKVIEENSSLIEGSPLVVIDANLANEATESIIYLCHQAHVPIFIEPTDVAAIPNLVECLKRVRGQNRDSLNSLLCMSPNLIELRKLVELFKNDTKHSNHRQNKALSIEDTRELALELMLTHLPELKCLLVTMDERGVMVAVRSASDPSIQVDQLKLLKYGPEFYDSDVTVKHFQVDTKIDRPVSASGAGDSFASGFISALLSYSNLADCVSKGLEAALLALQDHDTISNKLRLLKGINGASKGGKP